MRTITRTDFVAHVGREPKDDDLERCNCPKAGQLGHQACGWDEETQLPVFMVGFYKRNGFAP